jgi:hypothetical protein
VANPSCLPNPTLPRCSHHSPKNEKRIKTAVLSIKLTDAPIQPIQPIQPVQPTHPHPRHTAPPLTIRPLLQPHNIKTAPMPPFSRTSTTQSGSQDQDFYCSFTHLPQSSINADEIPYTLHNIYSIARLRHPMHLHRRMPSSGPRPDSFDSTATKRSYSSFFSTASSHRRRKLLAKLKQLFRGREPTAGSREVVLRASRKPSTLDFRCVGMDSRVDLGGMFTTPVYDAGTRDSSERKEEGPWGRPPRIDIALPGETEWGRLFEPLF